MCPVILVMYNNYVNVDVEDPMNPILSKFNCKKRDLNLSVFYLYSVNVYMDNSVYTTL